MNRTRNNQHKHLAMLLLLVLGMFGFTFALVPLYGVFCELTGLNGKISGPVNASQQGTQDPSPAIASLEMNRQGIAGRKVTIQFLAHVDKGMAWEFRPMDRQLRVRVGEMNATRFYVRNRASQAVTGQALPSVSPGQAAQYLHKTECFCFRQQRLEAGEAMEMPVTFIVDSELPEDIKTFSVSYTFFPAPELNGADKNGTEMNTPELKGPIAQAM